MKEETKNREGSSFYFNSGVKKRAVGSSRHYHNLFEIYYMKEGTCSTFVDNKIFEVTKGDIVLIPDGVVHKTKYGETPHTRLLINCSLDYIPETVLPYISKLTYLYRNPGALPAIDSAFEKIEAEWNAPDEFSDEIIRTQVFSIFFTMVRNSNRFTQKSDGSLLVEECVKYIQKNFMHHISLSETAKAHSVSAEHLSRTFKRETGFGFKEYVILVRLQRAETMLINENGKTISEIAYACGFNDSNYFSDKFKKNYGVSPTELKKKYLK